MYNTRSLGLVTVQPVTSLPNKLPPVNIAEIAAPKPAVVNNGTKFNAIATSISSIFNSAAPIVQAVVPNRQVTSSGGQSYIPLPGGQGTEPPPPPDTNEEKKDNTLLYVGIAAGVAVLGIGTAILLKRKKKGGVNGLGCPEPEKPAALAGVNKARKRKKSRTKKVRI